jgi:hypothetical protein
MYVGDVAPSITVHVELLGDDCHWRVPLAPDAVSVVDVLYPIGDVADTIPALGPVLRYNSPVWLLVG